MVRRPGRRLGERPDLLKQQQFVLIRAANPDGLAAKIRENSRGVVLNRNFPTRRLSQGILRRATGNGPASEPETRALLQILYEFRPQRVVHLFSTTGERRLCESARRATSPSGCTATRLDESNGWISRSCPARWKNSWTPRGMPASFGCICGTMPEDDVGRKLIPGLIVVGGPAKRPGPNRTTASPVSTPDREPARWQIGPPSPPVPPNPLPDRQPAVGLQPRLRRTTPAAAVRKTPSDQIRRRYRALRSVANSRLLIAASELPRLGGRRRLRGSPAGSGPDRGRREAAAAYRRRR